MALSRESWLPRAANLPVGARVRTQHDCGEGRTLLVSRDNDRFHAWCFRCNDGDSTKAPELPLAERIKALQAAAQADESVGLDPGKLPTPALQWRDWPDSARLWLLKAGLGAHDAGRMGAYYHPPTKRVVLPVYEAGEPVFWQARALDGRVPKYLAPQAPASGVLPRWGDAPGITLVEDLLSCYKVGTTQGCEAWCLMGTSLKPHTLAALLAARKPVSVWLDPDAAGIKAASRVAKTLTTFGLTARIISSKRDPKLIHRKEIQELLCTNSK